MKRTLKKDICGWCGKEIWHKGESRRFCSRECYGKTKAMKMKSTAYVPSYLFLAFILCLMWGMTSYHPELGRYTITAILSLTAYTIKLALSPLLWGSLFGYYIWELYKRK